MQRDLTDAEIERVITALTQVQCSPAPFGEATTCWHRNPDGPEAASLITALRERVRGLETVIAEARAKCLVPDKMGLDDGGFFKRVADEIDAGMSRLLTGGRDE